MPSLSFMSCTNKIYRKLKNKNLSFYDKCKSCENSTALQLLSMQQTIASTISIHYSFGIFWLKSSCFHGFLLCRFLFVCAVFWSFLIFSWISPVNEISDRVKGTFHLLTSKQTALCHTGAIILTSENESELKITIFTRFSNFTSHGDSSQGWNAIKS